MNGVSSVLFNYTTIFVNLYIWQGGASVFDLSFYNFILFLSWGLGFLTGSTLITLLSTRIPIQLASISAATGFTLLSTLHMANHRLEIAIIAVPMGAFGGLYFSAQNLSVSLFGQGPEFSTFFSYANLTGQVVAIVNPILSAIVIELLGFRGSFMLMFGFVVLMFCTTFMIPTLTLKPERLIRGLGFRDVFPTQPMRLLALGMVLGGVFLQFQGLFALLFTFHVTQNNVWIAVLNVGYTLASITGMFLYRKIKIRPGAWLWIGVMLVSLGLVVALLGAPVSLVISTVLTTVGLFYFNVVWSAEQFLLFHDLTGVEKLRVLAWRENLLCWGRMITLAAFLPLRHVSGIGLFALVGAAIVFSLLVPYVQHRAIRNRTASLVRHSVSVDA